MTVQPSSNWAIEYKKKFDQVFAKVQAGGDPTVLSQKAWGEWLKIVATGIEGTSPAAASKGTVDDVSFAPLAFSASTPPSVTLKGLAAAWENWYKAIKWSLIPPPPGLSSVIEVRASASGTAAASAIITASLASEGSQNAGGSDAEIAAKEARIAQIFYTATTTAGIEVFGLSSGESPAPTTLPFFPAG